MLLKWDIPTMFQCTGTAKKTQTKFIFGRRSQWGRGGNLCHCNAAYFAGKRGAAASDHALIVIGQTSALAISLERPPLSDENERARPRLPASVTEDLWTAMVEQQQQQQVKTKRVKKN